MWQFCEQVSKCCVQFASTLLLEGIPQYDRVRMLRTEKEHFAVPHFNINDLEWTKYILEECQKLDVPVILGVSDGAAKYMGGYDAKYGMVTGLIKDLNITIPVCLYVDHGCTETCKKAIDAGFTSVMIDASKYDFEENVRITKEVVDYAHSKGVVVEAELGTLAGVDGGSSKQSLSFLPSFSAL